MSFIGTFFSPKARPLGGWAGPKCWNSEKLSQAGPTCVGLRRKHENTLSCFEPESVRELRAKASLVGVSSGGACRPEGRKSCVYSTSSESGESQRVNSSDTFNSNLVQSSPKHWKRISAKAAKTPVWILSLAVSLHSILTWVTWHGECWGGAHILTRWQMTS